MSDLFNQLFIIPILNALVVFYKLFELVHLPSAFGLGIIALTAGIRILLWPLTAKQLASTAKIGKIQPQLAALQKKYKNDKARLQQEQLRLYQEAGINPAAGCLPIIIQIPLFLALFQVFTRVLTNGVNGTAVTFINDRVYGALLKIQHLDLSFFGLSLATKPNEWQHIGVWLLAVPIITGLLQYVQMQQMTVGKKKAAFVKDSGEAKPAFAKSSGEAKEEEDMTMQMQKQMALISPLMIGFFSYSFPIGLALYWNTFTVFGILQQYLVTKNKR